MAEEFAKSLIFYKARNTGDGAASQWALSSKKDCVFLEMANQTKSADDNPKFDWDNKIRFKLGETDIGELLAVLTGLQMAAGPFDTKQNKHKGLFHSTQTGNSMLYFGKDEHGRFRIYLSVKRGEEKRVSQHSLMNSEACVLAVLLRRAIEIMYNW